MSCVNIMEKKTFADGTAPSKVGQLKTDELTADTYYFKPGQVLDWHRHPTGDQIFFIQSGTGTFYLQKDGGPEESCKVGPEITIMAEKNVWHKLVADDGIELIASQATKQPAGMETR